MKKNFLLSFCDKQNAEIKKWEPFEAFKSKYEATLQDFKSENNITDNQFDQIFNEPERYFFAFPKRSDHLKIYLIHPLMKDDQFFFQYKAVNNVSFSEFLLYQNLSKTVDPDSTQKLFSHLACYLRIYSKCAFTRFEIHCISYTISSKFSPNILQMPLDYFGLLNNNLIMFNFNLGIRPSLVTYQNLKEIFAMECNQYIKDYPNLPAPKPPSLALLKKFITTLPGYLKKYSPKYDYFALSKFQLFYTFDRYTVSFSFSNDKWEHCYHPFMPLGLFPIEASTSYRTPYEYLYKLVNGDISLFNQIAVLVAKCLFTTNLHKSITVIEKNGNECEFLNFLYDANSIVPPQSSIPGIDLCYKIEPIELKSIEISKWLPILFNYQLNGIRYIVLSIDDLSNSALIEFISNLVKAKLIKGKPPTGNTLNFVNTMNVILVTNRDRDLMSLNKIPLSRISIKQRLSNQILSNEHKYWLRTVLAFYGANLLINPDLSANIEKSWRESPIAKPLKTVFDSFLSACCVFDKSFSIPNRELFNAYTKYCQNCRIEPFKKLQFRDALIEHLKLLYPDLAKQDRIYVRPHHSRSESNSYYYMGVKLNNNDTVVPEEPAESGNKIDYTDFCKFLDCLPKYLPEDFMRPPGIPISELVKKYKNEIK